MNDSVRYIPWVAAALRAGTFRARYPACEHESWWLHSQARVAYLRAVADREVAERRLAAGGRS